MQKKLPLIDNHHGAETRNKINLAIQTINDRGLEILSDSAFLEWLYENGIKHREEVQTFNDLPTNDSLNTVRGVFDDNKIYIKKENGWVPFQTIDISKINEVERKSEEIRHVAPINTFANISEGINSMYQTLPMGSWLKIPSGDHSYDKSLVFDREVNVDMTGAKMTYTGNSNNPALIIGKESGWTRRVQILGTYIRREATGKYENENEVGIRIINISHSKIDLSALNFYRGAEITSGNGCGNVYNQYNLGWLYDNFESIVLTTFNSTGWTNENNFYGGGFSILSTSSTTEHRHVVIEYKHGYRNNNNKFYGPSFEDAGHNAIAIDSDGASIYFFAPRFEGARIINMGENATDNTVFLGFGTGATIVNGRKSALNIYSDRHLDLGVDSRGLKLRRSTTAGNIINAEYAGTTQFNVDGQGNIRGRNLDILNRITARASNMNVIFDEDATSDGLTQGSLLLAKNGYRSAKLRLYGGVGAETGVKDLQIIHSGSTATRPAPVATGFSMFDSGIGKPIWWNGTNWVDSSGTIV